MTMHDTLRKRFREIAPQADFVSLRVLEETSEHISVRDDVLQPVQSSLDVGAMITVIAGGGLGYAATSDLSASGLRRAADRALKWAKDSARNMVHDFSRIEMPSPKGAYESRVVEPWDGIPPSEKAALLMAVCASAKRSERIALREVSLWRTVADSLYLTAEGGEAHQVQHLLAPDIRITANRGSESQSRTLGSRGYCRQGGLEILSTIDFERRAPEIADEALALLDAKNCPSGQMDLLLTPDQMMLQIHESIGHPIELDRILGDERNYAGTSFVTLDMFGTYQYGSELLNVTFDPTREGEFACFGFDDDGLPAERAFVIEKGKLVRPLGGGVSQARAGDVDGVATARASSWNRPPIDRMSNLNLEPGDATFDDLVSRVERGVLMRTNRSWSIDDSRNKFQFGCEWGQLIEDGKLGRVVKNPNYRGISASFWRSLKGVGDESTFEMLGTPYCGKGEPNQAIRVGHASPACLFQGVDVFGGEG
jgi:predicted Zn-dependent protease